MNAGRVRCDRIAGTDARRLVAILHAFLAAERIGHFDPAIGSALSADEIRRAVRSRQRINRIRARRVGKLRLDSDLVGDFGELTGRCIRKWQSGRTGRSPS